MKQFLATAMLTAVALFGLTQVSEANGLFRRCRGCDSGCGSAAPCAPAQAAAPKFEERKVTCYKRVMVEKEIDVIECKRVTREEKYNYTVCVAVTKPETRKVIVCETVRKEVDCEYTVMVPKTEQRKVVCTTYQCVREMVTCQVPVRRLVKTTCVDECGRCHTRRQFVTCMEERTRCVVKRVPITTEKMVNVTVCVPEVRKGKRVVCEIQRKEKEITVNVCRFEHQPREGTRTICEIQHVKAKRKVMVCETQAYETTVRVQVGGACSDCGSTGRGLFRRCGSCCK
ncbi:MAG: hypothetical protein HYX68_20915 [Planctomycetes bacterium]|nr:hypothetical protein [Planctomycetota bacterium]